MKEALLKRTTIVSTVFFLCAMCAIVVISFNKKIQTVDVVTPVEAESAKPQEIEETVTEPEPEIIDTTLKFDGSSANTEFLCIPLPEGTRPEDISIENHYMDLEFHIVLDGVSQDFYYGNVLTGNSDEVASGQFDEIDRKTVLNLKMNGLYECKTVMEDNMLYLSFVSPREMYDRIVVIDPAHGGKDTGDSANGLQEKDISLSIAGELKALLDESDIKAYYTRMDDVNPTEEARVSLANAAKADMFIRIETSDVEDTSVYGLKAVYNSEYFIPGFGNAELSDIIEKETVTGVNGKALEIEKTDDGDYVLGHATVPATSLSIGYVSNAQEAILLGREEYIKKIAGGIYNGILKAYEEKGK